MVFTTIMTTLMRYRGWEKGERGGRKDKGGGK
jgi:hypothetical protein